MLSVDILKLQRNVTADLKNYQQAHVKMKRKQIKQTFSELYWLLGRNSTQDVYCKRFPYNKTHLDIRSCIVGMH